MSKDLILVVEDDSIEAMDIKNSLELAGYIIPEIITNGNDALEFLSKTKPDIILMDITLKGDKSGIDTAQIIKDNFNIPLIYLTAHSDNATFDKSKITQPYAYLIKPFDSNELIRTIEIALNRSRLEKELEDSREHLQNLFENSPVGIFQSSPEGKFLIVNKTLADMLGYDSALDLMNNINKTGLDELYVDKKHESIVRNVIKDDKWHSHKIKIYKKDRNIMIADLSIRTVKDDNSGIKYLEGFVNDITKHKIIEESLIISEDKYRTLFESDPNYTILLDTNHKIVDVNNATTNITGLSRIDLIGKPLNELDLILEEDKILHVEQIINLIDGYDVKPFEARLLDKNGKLRWVNIRLTSIEKENVVSYILINASDITELKQYEKEIQDSLHKKEILLQEIHHRVKNNMQIISSLLSIQTRYVDDRDSINVLKESQNRVKSLAMIHEKLYKSKNFDKIYLLEYIESLVWDLFYSYAIKKGRIIPILDIDNIKLNIETSVPCGLIITELVSNCLKYAFPNQKEGELKVSLKSVGNEYKLIISDNGIGIPENIDFFNTESLGLQLVNSLTDQIDGKIEFNRDNGTEFKITFKELVYKDRF
jgi:PAS domain S-box-containing protein